MKYYGKEVNCENCGKNGEVVFPEVKLLGQSVVYTEDEGQGEQAFLVLKDSEVCYDCLEDGEGVK